MGDTDNSIRSSVIISVYKDDTALRLILNSLLQQSVTDFEIIVSEDCQSAVIKECVASFRNEIPGIVHLSQEDIGFRKNIALNRAISAAHGNHLIFIDGDCVPHPAFVEAHQKFAQAGIACTGRRLELGENVSKKLREGKIKLSYLTNITSYLLHMIPLLLDKAKNIESGINSRYLHSRIQDKEIRILGCNFSCSKSDLIKINGFNEEYLAAGIGEDSDIDWRLIHTGVTIKNVKFSAIQYHLYHPRLYNPSKENEAILDRTKEQNLIFCEKGLRK